MDFCKLARGVRGLPAVANMLKLRWVEELAREAQRWADQCQPPGTPENHDECRDLYSITVGQCVASVIGEAPGLRFETMVDMWPMQGRLYKRSLSNLTRTYFSSDHTNGYYGDFAQMFWSRAYMVGCGRSRFMVPWYGRERSVDRLVCNFAPRWSDAQRALWSPGNPASACPSRSGPDTETTSLCTYHYTMDETYDDDNKISLEEHMLLNTILEIERNASLDYIGSMDQLYLTKLAVATIYEHSVSTSPFYTINSVQKRSYDQTQETTSIERDINYDDYEFVEMEEGTATVKTITNYLKELLPTTESKPREKEDIYLNTKAYINETKDVLMMTDTFPSTTYSSNIPRSINTETFGMFLNDMVFNLSISEILNESKIDANVLDDYLSDPETVHQLQKALDRMERNLAASPPSFTLGKVRRELRNLQNTDEQTLQNEGQKIPEDSSEIERNKTVDRRPMLSMVLKYMPYLKPFEKSIIGDSNVNSGRVIGSDGLERRRSSPVRGSPAVEDAWPRLSRVGA
ncbi:uncharacterized protein LOC120626437 [Pararge aegeria]|uniref:uncharacterized protein LOC120626437 n=1 Tax=Pararge aegeria TaxID=116150 RepID=UPI0019D24FB7|nr:uncharacterized protein LOC120626437 [Pararge aegeria]